jgi:hypothetical protein
MSNEIAKLEYEILRNTSQALFDRTARISMECHSNRMARPFGTTSGSR